MESYFLKYRKNIIGIDQEFTTLFGKSTKIVYADWTASGRCYLPIEKRMQEDILPFVANTHTEITTTGKGMTYAYHKARTIIKKHVNANSDDIIISSNSGMTGVVNKFQRILGLKIHEHFRNKITLTEEDRPIIFITHMEHHSNHTTWLETIGEVKIIDQTDEGLVDLDHFEMLLKEYRHRKLKIAAVTSCSNVTGIFTPYKEIAKIIHRENGYCFVDFACSAPYINIDMHPNEDGAHLDAIYFSPHKFLGGPGSSGILIFNKKVYTNSIPDEPGGGTVDWTNPWGEHKYINDIEDREDGGTPAFLQTIRVAMCIKLKEEMGIDKLQKREKQLLTILWNRISKIKELHILAPEQKERLGIISFYVDDLHYNLGVKLLNDKFGIQTRGGCSCAGTYGHYLLHVGKEYSKQITDLINIGDYSKKPGWIRVALHPTMTNEEVEYIADSIESLVNNHTEWAKDYIVDKAKNLVKFKNDTADNFITDHIDKCFWKPFA